MKKIFFIFLIIAPVLIFSLKNKSDETGEAKNDLLIVTENSDENKYPNDIEYIKRTFPFGEADPDAHLEALKKGQQMRQAAETDNNLIATWDFAGPENIGGRTSDLEYDPNNPNIVYAGAATGGVFKSTDGGVTFFSIFDDLAVLPIGDIAVDPVNSNIIILPEAEFINQLTQESAGN